MRSKLLLPILVSAVITGLAVLIAGAATAGEIPSTSHYKVLAPIGHGNLTVFPVVTTTYASLKTAAAKQLRIKQIIHAA